jgi:hypothetical protein
MTPADIAAVALLALTPAETLIGTTVLLDRLRGQVPDPSPDGLMRALVAAGWSKRRWRVGK